MITFIAAVMAALSSAQAAPLRRADAILFSVGAALAPEADGLRVETIWPGSPAAGMGLREGDLLLGVDGSTPRSLEDAAKLRVTAPPEQTESVIVRRGLATFSLVGERLPAPAGIIRGANDLSAHERALAESRTAKDSFTAQDSIAAAATQDWTLRADQQFWVRFPEGVLAGLKLGDSVVGEATAGLTTDAKLDFLAIPPRSRVWARVVAAEDDGEVRVVRLLFYKLALFDGGTYPITAVPDGLAGIADARSLRLSAGGTLIAAAPLPPADGKKKRGPDYLLDADARLRLRFREPVSLIEPPSWWRAGPGLWLRTAPDGRRGFEVAVVIPGRAAAAAGIHAGDRIDSINGRSAEKMDFADATAALYGEPGSMVKLGVAGAGRVELIRGAKLDVGGSIPLTLPFETR